MKKKIMGIVLVLVLALSLLLTACNKTDGEQHSETYKGTVSEQKYNSSDAAANAFIENEISGSAVEATVVSCESQGALTDEEKTELALSDSYTTNLEKVEKVRIGYKETVTDDYSAYGVRAVADESNVKYRVIFVLVYKDGSYRYFSPIVLKGEQLTASYFDSVFNTENYYNCTMNQDLEMAIDVNVNGNQDSQTVESTSAIKVTQDSLYFTSAQKAGTQNLDAEMYLVNKNNDISGAVKTNINGKDSDWLAEKNMLASIMESMGLSGDILSFTDFLDTYFDQSFGTMDHTCFEKTDMGYALRDGMGKQFIIETIESTMGGESGTSEILKMINLFDIDLNYEIIVNNGLVSKLKIDMTIFFDYSRMPSANAYGVTGTMKLTEKATCSFTDFGTTEITVPDEVLALIS